MLISSRLKKRRERIDWFPNKTYLHFDGPISRVDAEALVMNRTKVISHSFLPLMTFEKRDRRYRRGVGGMIEISTKIRKIAYCSNRDACIFSYYAHLLTPSYENLIASLGLDKAVIGYRKIGSNVELAKLAFAEIEKRVDCVAFAYDVSGFFDNIDHAVLKRNWTRTLGGSELPEDHYRLFRRLTKFSLVNRQAALKRLGYKPTARDHDIKSRPICSMRVFQELIRGGDGVSTNLVQTWKREYGIPQGTPLSALAANISMIDFDVEMLRAVTAIGGSYRRYSDDILVIVPTSSRSVVDSILKAALKTKTRRLKINSKKTDEIEFVSNALANGDGSKWLQYLGLTFNGKRFHLRSSTTSKFYRRMHRVIRSAKRRQRRASVGEAPGRKVLYVRGIMTALSHLGVRNFVTSYAATATAITGDKGIRQQLRKHTKMVSQIIAR